jgi:hypothetical protein
MRNFPRKLHQPLGVNERLDFTGLVCWRVLAPGQLNWAARQAAAWQSPVEQDSSTASSTVSRVSPVRFWNRPTIFLLPAFGVLVLEIVIRELGPILFQLAINDVPVAIDFECDSDHHNGGQFCFLFSFAVNVPAEVSHSADFHDSKVDAADKLLSPGKKSPEGQQTCESGAEQQKRAATIRHRLARVPFYLSWLTIVGSNGIMDQTNEAILCQQSAIHCYAISQRNGCQSQDGSIEERARPKSR